MHSFHRWAPLNNIKTCHVQWMTHITSSFFFLLHSKSSPIIEYYSKWLTLEYITHSFYLLDPRLHANQSGPWPYKMSMNHYRKVFNFFVRSSISFNALFFKNFKTKHITIFKKLLLFFRSSLCILRLISRVLKLAII